MKQTVIDFFAAKGFRVLWHEKEEGFCKLVALTPQEKKEALLLQQQKIDETISDSSTEELTHQVLQKPVTPAVSRPPIISSSVHSSSNSRKAQI